MRSPDDEKKFIVLEGNRRIAAVKIMYNVNVLSDLRISPALKKRFEKAAREFKAENVEPISCYEMSREEANSWIQRRHTGEDSGRGIGMHRPPRASAAKIQRFKRLNSSLSMAISPTSRRNSSTAGLSRRCGVS